MDVWFKRASTRVSTWIHRLTWQERYNELQHAHTDLMTKHLAIRIANDQIESNTIGLLKAHVTLREAFDALDTKHQALIVKRSATDSANAAAKLVLMRAIRNHIQISCDHLESVKRLILDDIVAAEASETSRKETHAQLN